MQEQKREGNIYPMKSTYCVADKVCINFFVFCFVISCLDSMTMYELRLVHPLPSNRKQLENNDNSDLQQLSEVIVNVSLIKVFCKISIYI